MRWLRRVLAGLFLLIVLLVAAAVIFVSTTDFTNYKDTIAAELKAATGREVTIGGKIETKLLSMTPAIVVHDLALANTPWGTRKDMVRIRRLEVRVSLMSVISGQVNINRMGAVEPDILLETDKQGRQNWIFAGTNAQGTGQAGGADLAVKALRVVRAKIAYRDGATGDTDRFGIDRLTARAKDPAGPMTFEAVGTVEREAVRLKGRIGPPADLFAGRAVEVMFTGSLGRSNLAANLVVQSTEKLAIKGSISSDYLETKNLGGAKKTAAATPIFGEDPIPVGLLRILNADVNFKARTVKLSGTPMTNVTATIRVHDGVLNVTDLRADVAGGQVAGAVTVDAAMRPAKFMTKATVSGLSLRQLTPQISGPMSLNLDVRGIGDTPRAIANTLNGHVALIGGPGRVANEALVLLTFGLGSIQKLLTRGSVRAENVNCVVARFDLSGGIGRSRVLVTDSARLTFIGQGTISLKSEQLDLLFVPRTKETGLGDITVHPVRVTGPILRPNASVDPSAAAKEAAKNVIDTARRGLNFVGSLVGATERENRSASPCARAIAIAGGRASPAPTSSGRFSGQSGAPASPRKKKGLLQRLNPFD